MVDPALSEILKHLSPEDLDQIAQVLAEAKAKTGFFEVGLVFRKGKFFSIDPKLSINVGPGYGKAGTN